MKNKLHILVVEDNPDDLKILEYELNNNKIDFVIRNVTDEQLFNIEINEFAPDIIISDYSLPHFDGMKALKIAKKFNPLIPFIIITGSLNELIAVECIKAGAEDYVLKEHIKMIGPSILNSLEKRKLLEEKYRAEKEVFHWKERYEFVANTSGHVVYEYDINTGLIIWGNTIEEVLGYKKSDISKLDNFFEKIHPDDAMALFRLVNIAKKEIGEIDTEYRFKHKSDEYIFIHNNGAFVPGKDGKAKSMIGMIKDITEQKLARQKLIFAKEEAEKLSNLKTEFLAQMSHEIRTPINSIKSYTSLLKEELISKIEDNDLKNGFYVIEKGCNRLIRTIDMILNMSKLQSGNFETNPTYLNLEKDILENVILEFYASAKEKKLELVFINEGVIGKVYVDHYTVNQIFINLIDNAIKYTPTGKVEVKLYKKNEKYCVEVKDTGIGISDEYIPNLFTPFSQEDTGYTRNFEGNGLGLALINKYAELNNASIEVKSIKGKGSSFTVIFNT